MNVTRAGTWDLAVRVLRQCGSRQPKQVLLGLVVLALSSGVALLQPWPLKLVFDSVLGHHAAPGPLHSVASAVPIIADERLRLLVVLCLGVLLVQLLIGAMNVLSTYILLSVGLRMVFDLRCLLFDHLQRLSWRFHDETPVGDSLYRVTWDTYGVQSLFNGGLAPAVTAVLTLFGITAIMLALDWRLTLAALGIGIPLVVLVKWFDRPISERSMSVHEQESAVSSRVQETLTGIRAVQSFGMEDIEGHRFRQRAIDSLRANLHLTVLQTGSQAAVGSLLAAGTALVVYVGATAVLSGRLTLGDLVLAVSYLAMLYQPLQTLAYTATTVQGSVAGIRRVYAVLDDLPDVHDLPGAIDLPGRARGDLHFENVTFGYKPDQIALRHVFLTVPSGQTLALVGSSGAGKTTLASIIMRFYDPEAGSITLDGRDLRTLTLRSLRANVALVLQEPILFSATIRENIAYGRPDASLLEVIAAATAAGAHEFISALPRGYDTELGERGISLSGGQRQRLSIARAFLKDAPILILDEPTSALDAETEAELVATLEGLKQGRTTIIIAHRLSTIRHADRIVVLDRGYIAEEGSYRDLLRANGLFRRLHDIQFGKQLDQGPRGEDVRIAAGRPA